MINKVVVHFQDGRVLKGVTNDFLPARDQFHLSPIEGGKAEIVMLPQLKAIFFVKDYVGNPEKKDSQEIEKPLGKKVVVTFKDGEKMVGTTQAYHPDKQGFFFFPADPTSNTERCFVVKAGTSDIKVG